MEMDFIEYGKSEIIFYIKVYTSLDEDSIKILSKEIMSKVDWKNSALMHKGFSWIVKNYLSQRGLLESQIIAKKENDWKSHFNEIVRDIKTWEQYKKDAYNEMFTNSKHATKI